MYSIFPSNMFILTNLRVGRPLIPGFSRGLRIFPRFFKRGRSPKKEAELNGDRIANWSETQDRLWRNLVPEKYIDLNSSSFLILAALTLALHQYNSRKDGLSRNNCNEANTQR
ncbi:hypothetical protein HWI79_2450 [Cryptosporidium felis]|nr:hypothetical protein HWI79_2450 [Cryptosporidium felis]